MFSLSVGAVFRNESHSICEWIEHYLNEGVEQFYLIDDESDDDTVAKIQQYIERGLVTLHQPKVERYIGRQRDMYNAYVLPHLRNKETKWVIMVDLDEYLWSPSHSKLVNLFKEFHGIGQVQVQHTLYGSNGHITQPKSVIEGFTKRTKELPSESKCYKYAVCSDYEFSSLNVHHADFSDKKNEEYPTFMMLGSSYLVLNHYNCQSEEFWREVKCKRGDSDHYRVRNMDDFRNIDVNEFEDKTLYEKNKHIWSKILDAN